MFDQTFDFSVHKLPEFKDHSLVTAQIYAPAAAQMKTTLRQVCEVPKLSKRTQNDNPLPSQLSSKFSEAIAQNDVDRAFQYWSLEFERVLLQVSQRSCKVMQGQSSRQPSAVTSPFTNREHTQKHGDSKLQH
jgi:hypothetical protein